jgi:CBS domain-containing protein
MSAVPLPQEIVDRIERAEGAVALAEALRAATPLLHQLWERGPQDEAAATFLNRCFLTVHRRAVEIALSQLGAEGRGEPPVPFAFLLLGSHGRGEAHLGSDQDHGMVLVDYPDERRAEVEAYFIELSVRVGDMLEEAGFPRCEGNVMSANPVWRKCLSEWKDQVRGWYADPDGRAVRYTTIFYDFAPAWGDEDLADALREHVMRALARNQHLLRALYEEAAGHRVPLKMFKRFDTPRSGAEKGLLDLKRSGLLYLAECTRILALRHGVRATSTLMRLHALEAAEVLAPEEAEAFRVAHRTLYHFVLGAELDRSRQGLPPATLVSPDELSEGDRQNLREALGAVERLQAEVHAAFGQIFF